MPNIELHALLLGADVHPAARFGGPHGARVRFGNEKATRLKRCRRLRRTQFNVDVLTLSGCHRATLASITLYGATLDSGSRLRRREILALRLPSGGRVQARARWRLGRRCGVQFLSPVADFARLLHESRLVQGAQVPSRAQRTTPPPANGDSDPLSRLRGALSRAQRLGRQVRRWCRSL